MNNDDELRELREVARELKYSPGDPALETRLKARVMARVREGKPTVVEFLARWLRPVAATLVVVSAISWYALSDGDDAGVLLEPELVIASSDYYVVAE